MVSKKNVYATAGGIAAAAIGQNFLGEPGLALGIPVGLATQYNREIYDRLFSAGVRNIKEILPSLDDIKTYHQRHPKGSKAVGGTVGAGVAVSAGVLTGGAGLAVYLFGLGALGAYSGSLIADPRTTLGYTAKPFKAVGRKLSGLPNGFRRPEISEANYPGSFAVLREVKLRYDPNLTENQMKSYIQDGAARALYFDAIGKIQKDPELTGILIDEFNVNHRWKDKMVNNGFLNGIYKSLYKPYKTIKDESLDIVSTIPKIYRGLQRGFDSGAADDKKEKDKETKSEGKGILSRIGSGYLSIGMHLAQR